jgi:pre-60S factor REI1
MDDDDDLYAAYEKEITTHGFDITPLGELVFPDGRIVGHRALARYYKQRFAPDPTERAAVRAAKEAAGDRLYAGRVYNMYQLKNQREANDNSTEGETFASTALTAMGRMSGNMPTGRMGKGILVAGGGKGGFTSLSLYHYRAVVKKQRRDDARGQRLQLRSRMNMNRMDKKANNKMNGVIVALAPR